MAKRILPVGRDIHSGQSDLHHIWYRADTKVERLGHEQARQRLKQKVEDADHHFDDRTGAKGHREDPVTSDKSDTRLPDDASPIFHFSKCESCVYFSNRMNDV